MAQRIFQSFRRLPGQIASFRKKHDVLEVHGNSYKLNICTNYGFPAKPTSIAYDPLLDLLALLCREGSLMIYGKPGVSFTGSHTFVAEFIQVLFLRGTHKLITLSGSNDITLWELTTTTQSTAYLVQLTCLHSATGSLHTLNASGIPVSETETDVSDRLFHITSLLCRSDGKSLLLGTDQGWVVSVRINTPTLDKSKAPKEFCYLTKPSLDEAITPTRILESIAPSRHQRFRLDAVVVLDERPGFPGQLLIGYASGLCLLFDVPADRVVALLPWKIGLESATWCGGTGLPHPTVSNAHPLHRGMRLLTAYSDGSLGTWNLSSIGAVIVTSSPVVNPPSLSLEEPPRMPYGPFPCKSISKVFWMSSHLGGITAFAGGMPRATYGQHHTVSVLRGSTMDLATAARMTEFNLAVAFSAEDDEDDDDNLQPFNPLATTPIHVFDADAPEHVCFDLSSPIVDFIPVGSQGGSVQMLLILCEEELVAVDLVTDNWPFMRPPYLACLHTSTITTYNLVTQANPHLLNQLESAGSFYGPEGQFGRGSLVVSSPNSVGWSELPWPLQGGHALVSGSRLSPSSVGDKLLYTDDLLITGHEDGSVAFWRTCAGGSLRRIYTLHSAVLFDGDFGLLNHTTAGMEEDTECWPPFRQAGVFDPFMDDSRAAVHLINLNNSTLAVGGAAGQVSIWQFSDFAPPLSAACSTIKSDIPGLRWQGYAPLKLRPGIDVGATLTRQDQSCPPAQLQPVGVVTVQPPARCTALRMIELSQPSTTSTAVILAVGTPHGYTVVYFPPCHPPPGPGALSDWVPVSPQVLLTESTLPDNIEALHEAAVGEGWARRRTRELKKSLRDSFRRLKRKKSIVRTTDTNQPDPQPPMRSMSRVGVRRTVTQTARGDGRSADAVGPLEMAESRANPRDTSSSAFPSITIEREICERPTESANIAIVSYFTFGPPLFHSSSTSLRNSGQIIGSLFVGTKAGVVKAYRIWSDTPASSSASCTADRNSPILRLQLVKQLVLQHRAPILNLVILDSRSYQPYWTHEITTLSNKLSLPSTTHPPNLLVTSEEQVRLFSLPSLKLRQKARITAKDGFRIKVGSIVSFRVNPGLPPTSSGKLADDPSSNETGRVMNNVLSTSPQRKPYAEDQRFEYSYVFANVGGQAVVLSLPQLTRKDSFEFLDSNDVIAISSVTFAESGCSETSAVTSVIAPSLGICQHAPGQLTLFDIVRTNQRVSFLGSSYLSIQRLPSASSSTVNSTQIDRQLLLHNGSIEDSSGYSSHILPPPRSNPRQNRFTPTTSSHTGSQANSSLMSNTLSDSVRDCHISPSSTR